MCPPRPLSNGGLTISSYKRLPAKSVGLWRDSNPGDKLVRYGGPRQCFRVTDRGLCYNVGVVGCFPQMVLSPTRLDIWVVTVLASLLRRHALIDLTIQSAIRHNILGGFWFAAALFVFWLQGAKGNDPKIRLRILTTLVGSTLAILLTLLASAAISWPPPIHHPDLSSLFPNYIDRNPNTNCFPSQSTALYASVAAGIYSLHRRTGMFLWIAVAAFVALPRMYVGGHYLTDVVVGVVLAWIGFLVARYFLESTVISKLDAFFQESCALRVASDFLVFVWILQVAVEFRDADWFKSGLEMLLG